ncbi:MFS transporter [Brevibacillus dissolubilis]|uniref:MFS transporter n=1 Tax=Brevibacillus dissolubilis TaxID=1844116 RepID=UPI001117757D|nr:MFS transporter [Brevibacillus dissolubilis]
MNPSFYFLWAGQSIVNVAGAFYTVAIVTLVYHATGSATLAAVVSLLRVLSQLLSGFSAPLLMDRYRLRSILAGAQIGQMALLVTMIVVIGLTGGNAWDSALWGLLGLITIVGFLDGWVVPSRQALLPRLVEEEKLVKANSLLSTTDQTLALFGWSFGGILAAWFGEEKLLWLTLVLYVLSTASYLFIREPDQPVEAETKQKGMQWDTIKAGWVAIWERRPLRMITLMDMIEGIAGGIWIGGLTLVFVKEVLHQGEEWWGYINAGYYAGAIVGGLLILSQSRRVQNHLFASIAVGSFGVSLLTLGYALTGEAWIALAMVFVMGPFYELRDIAQRTYFQAHVERELLPKVFSAQSTISYATFGISVFVMGAVSDWLGIRTVYIFAAVLYFISSGLVFMNRKKAMTA